MNNEIEQDIKKMKEARAMLSEVIDVTKFEQKWHQNLIAACHDLDCAVSKLENKLRGKELKFLDEKNE